MAESGNRSRSWPARGDQLPARLGDQLPTPVPRPEKAGRPPKEPAAPTDLFGSAAFVGTLVAAAMWLWLLLSPEMRSWVPPAVGLGVGFVVAGAFWLGGDAVARSGFGARLSRLADVDLFGLPWLPIFAILYYGVRYPLMHVGYGGDPDAWRIAMSGVKLWRLGVYEVSRFPGYPAVEIGLSPVVVFLGPLAACLVTATVGLLGLAALNGAGRRLGFPAMGLVTAIMAFAPLFVVNTANTMDYVYSLSALLGTLWALTAGRHALAGILFGLAVGSRLPTAVFAAPLGLWVIFGRRSSPAEIARFVLLSVLVAGACFAPVVMAYGIRFFSHTNPEITEASVSEYAVWATGVVPPLLFGGLLGDALAGHGRKSEHAVGDATSNGLLVIGLLAVPMALFIYLPIQSGYLLPALPFLLMLAARLATPLAIAVFGLALVVSNAHDLSASPLRDLKMRTDIVVKYDTLRDQLIPPGAVVFLGGAAFATAFVLGDDLVWNEDPPWPRALIDQTHDVVYMTKLTDKQLDKAIAGGHPVYVLNQEVDSWSVRMQDYSPVAHGAIMLGVGDAPESVKKSGKKKDKAAEPVEPVEGKADAAPAGDNSAEAAPAEGEEVAPSFEIDAADNWIVEPAKKLGGPVRFIEKRTRIEGTKAAIPLTVCQAQLTRARAQVKVLGKWRIKEALDEEGLRVYLRWYDEHDKLLTDVDVAVGKKELGDWVELAELANAPDGARAARLCATVESRVGEVALDNLRLQKVR